MVDGAHWCTPVTLPWGELVLQTIDDCLDDAACAANVSAAWSNRAPRTDEDECACLKRKAAQCGTYSRPAHKVPATRRVDRELATIISMSDLKDDVDDRARAAACMCTRKQSCPRRILALQVPDEHATRSPSRRVARPGFPLGPGTLTFTSLHFISDITFDHVAS